MLKFLMLFIAGVCCADINVANRTNVGYQVYNNGTHHRFFLSDTSRGLVTFDNLDVSGSDHVRFEPSSSLRGKQMMFVQLQ